RVPVVRESHTSETLPRLLQHLKETGVRVLATAPSQGAAGRGRNWFDDKPLTGACAILLGGEGPGLSAELIASSAHVLSIPTQPPVESLNVAVSAAVIIYEARRQRQEKNERLTVRG